jgi:hypothetical protein
MPDDPKGGRPDGEGGLADVRASIQAVMTAAADSNVIAFELVRGSSAASPAAGPTAAAQATEGSLKGRRRFSAGSADAGSGGGNDSDGKPAIRLDGGALSRNVDEAVAALAADTAARPLAGVYVRDRILMRPVRVRDLGALAGKGSLARSAEAVITIPSDADSLRTRLVFERKIPIRAPQQLDRVMHLFAAGVGRHWRKLDVSRVEQQAGFDVVSDRPDAPPSAADDPRGIRPKPMPAHAVANVIPSAADGEYAAGARPRAAAPRLTLRPQV